MLYGTSTLRRLLTLALYMVERPQPYTLPLHVPQVCTMPELGDGFQDLSRGSIHVPQGHYPATCHLLQS